MQDEHHHCDQWAILPQVHILDATIEVKDLQGSIHFEFEFKPKWKYTAKKKKEQITKGAQPHWAGFGRRPLLLSFSSAQPTPLKKKQKKKKGETGPLLGWLRRHPGPAHSQAHARV